MGNKGKVHGSVLVQDMRTVVYSQLNQRSHVHTSFISQFSDPYCITFHRFYKESKNNWQTPTNICW